MAVQECLMIGQSVKYSITKDAHSTGLVLDKIVMLEKPSDTNTVTGYMIRDYATGDLKPVAYWRVIKLIASNQDDMPKGHIVGGRM